MTTLGKYDACPYVAAMPQLQSITYLMHFTLYVHSFIYFVSLFGLASSVLYKPYRSQVSLGLGEPFLLEDGTVEVPVNCSLNALRDFCLNNLSKIRETRRKHERCVHTTLKLVPYSRVRERERE